MFEIGLSAFGKVINEELFSNYSRAGISAMELTRRYEEYVDLDFENIGKLAYRYGVRLNSLHLPFAPFDIVDISNPQICRQTLEIHSELIRKAADIGIGIFVVHSSSEPIPAQQRYEKMQRAKESLCVLADVAARNGAMIAVEDLPRTCIGRNSSEISELTQADERLRICLDTNHLLGESLKDFIRRVGSKIVTTHISDYDFLNERHWLPGEGDIDWQELVSSLKEVGYNGAWLYEVDFKRPPSIAGGRDLTCEDFARNAKEIFENKPITVFAKRAAGLEKWTE